MFWEAFWEPWTFENHAKVYNYMHFQGLDPCGAESVSGSVFGRGLACVFQDFGADWETHWIPFDHFWQLFQGLIWEAVFGKHRGAKSTRNGLAGGRGGAC